MSEMNSAKNAIDRIMNLKTYEITADVPDTLEFRGAIMYDVIIREDKITMKIPAISYEEALEKSKEFLGTN
jgi:hypothetical protein